MEKGTFKKQLPAEISPQNKLYSVPLHTWGRAGGMDTNEAVSISVQLCPAHCVEQMDFWALTFSLKEEATDLEPGFEMGNSRKPWKRLGSPVGLADTFLSCNIQP